MKLELPIRWTETDREIEKLKDILDDRAPQNETKYSYGRLIIHSKDVGPMYDIDANHTMINDKNGKLYCVVVPLDDLKRILTETTGIAILAVQTKEDYRNNSRSRGKGNGKASDDDINDIIKP